MAKRFGTDTAPVEEALSVAKAVFDNDRFHEAIQKVAEAVTLLEDLNRANKEYREVNEAIEGARVSLGQINDIMTMRVGSNEFPKDDERVKEMMDVMGRLSVKFYELQSRLLREGPKDMAQEAAKLLKDTQELESSSEVLFGI